MEKNGTPASPATALASRVLPVPGGPMSSTPLGIWPPSCWNFCGSLRNSTISSSSSLASSMPATSSKRTLLVSSVSILALLLPNDMAPLPPVPPPCICRMKKIHTAISSSMGNQEMRMESSMEVPSSGLAVMETSCLRSSFTTPESCGA